MLCAYTRPRYQVSIYRTIGPLVVNCSVTVQGYINHLITYLSVTLLIVIVYTTGQVSSPPITEVLVKLKVNQR